MDPPRQRSGVGEFRIPLGADRSLDRLLAVLAGYRNSKPSRLADPFTASAKIGMRSSVASAFNVRRSSFRIIRAPRCEKLRNRGFEEA